MAWAVEVGLLVTAIVVIGDATRTGELLDWIAWLTPALAGWLVAGPISAHLIGRRFA